MPPNPTQPSAFRRALAMRRGPRLRPFRGNDPAEIERKVADYYASAQSRAYYGRLADQDLWTDTARRARFSDLCAAAATILDFGCGAGGLAVALAARFPDKTIHATDFGAHAGAAIAGAPAPNLRFQPGSVLAAPYPDGAMDLVVSRFVIEHTTRPDGLLREARRVLKPGGHLYLLYPQLLVKVGWGTALREALSWLTASARPLYLDPQIGEGTHRAEDMDAVWLTNPIKIARLLRRAGFLIETNRPGESLAIARKT
jgi:SAM-dependent methyltransferase